MKHFPFTPRSLGEVGPAHQSSLRRVLSPFNVTVIGFFLLTFFFVWVLSVLVPVIIVEAKYQYRKTLVDVFQTQSLRGLIMPQFRIIFAPDASKNKLAGITIPAIYVDEPIIFNVDPNNEQMYLAALKQGIAHASSTGLPGTGTIGYYFAHSSSPGFAQQLNAVFYLLGKLKVGNEIFVWRESEHYDYVVTETKITTPNDVSFLAASYDKETIVLQTCWPPATTQKRLLVFAERKL